MFFEFRKECFSTYTSHICSLNTVFHKQTKFSMRDSSRVSAKLSLLGLMAKIKCSICSYQFNIWYAGQCSAHILIWFLAFGQGSEVYLTLTTGCLGFALQPSAAHPPLYEQRNTSFLRNGPSTENSENVTFLLKIGPTTETVTFFSGKMPEPGEIMKTWLFIEISPDYGKYWKYDVCIEKWPKHVKCENTGFLVKKCPNYWR